MEFKRLADVEVLESATDEANVLIEENGEIKRVPKTEVGGTGFPTAIIKDSYYDNVLAGISTMISGPKVTYECTNMTFEEAYEIMANGGILNVIGMLTPETPAIVPGVVLFAGTGVFGVPCIIINFIIGFDAAMTLFWTSDGISMSEPDGGGEAS